jgi:hypothetical protein
VEQRATVSSIFTYGATLPCQRSVDLRYQGLCHANIQLNKH